jgi:hypothetical protein
MNSRRVHRKFMKEMRLGNLSLLASAPKAILLGR